MKIFMVTMGTRGDVQPFIALGQGLKRAGHEITLCTHERFRPFIEERGLAYGYMGDEILKFIGNDAVREVIDDREGVVDLARTLLKFHKQIKPMIRLMLDEEWAAVQDGVEAIIYNPRAYGGYHLAEKLGVPGIMATPFPAYVPTRDFPLFAMPGWRLGGGYNRLTYAMVPLGLASYAGMINQWRKEALDLPPRPRFDNQLKGPDGRPILGLHCYSPSVQPTPADWPESIITTGYWFLDRQEPWRPPDDLLEFLEAGPPPVYVGFGSMVGSKPEKLGRISLEALALSGQRGLMGLGWGGLKAANLPKNVFKIETAPHDWLFPRMAAVVHHGGAGTTAAGLRAGKATVTVPFIGDQFFWAKRLQELGVGPPPVPKKKLKAERLAQAIRVAVSDEEIRRRAGALGEQIRAEDGIGTAIDFIHRHLEG